MEPHKTEVGIRELRSELRQWIDAVKSGRELVITERGRPVARIVPATGLSSIEALLDAGAMKKPRSPARLSSAHQRVHASGDVSGLVKEQRR